MKKTGKMGFTLLEMLVAMAIIALLAGLLLPAVSKAKEQSRRTRAREEISQLVMAWKTLLQDKREFKLPGSWSGGEMDATAMNYLKGYLDISKKDDIYGFLDPWGGLYSVALDTDYDGTVMTGDHGAIDQSVVAWSKGRKNGKDGTPDDPSDDVMSW